MTFEEAKPRINQCLKYVCTGDYQNTDLEEFFELYLSEDEDEVIRGATKILLYAAVLFDIGQNDKGKEITQCLREISRV